MTLSEALAASEQYESMTNEIFEVDPTLRTITVPSGETVFGVYQDRNVERKYFICPRYIGDMIDLSECYIFVNYESVSGTIGQYQCDDIEIDGDYVTFSWLLSGNVFDDNIDGIVQYAIQVKTSEGKNVFLTRPASGEIYATIEADDVIEEEYADVIMQWIAIMETIEPLTEEAAESADNASSSASAAAESTDEASDYATLSESWAIGDTGTRTDEDTDNSKYYSQMARAHALEDCGFSIDDDGYLVQEDNY